MLSAPTTPESRRSQAISLTFSKVRQGRPTNNSLIGLPPERYLKLLWSEWRILTAKRSQLLIFFGIPRPNQAVFIKAATLTVLWNVFPYGSRVMATRR